ncbi:MAG: thermonuclease family protein [Phycisphaerae bacterium]
MIAQLIKMSLDRHGTFLCCGAGGVFLLLLSAAFVSCPGEGIQDTRRIARSYRAKIERIRSGHKVKLGTGETLVYAGIRSPYPNEALYEEARNRNAALVEGKKVRLRYDEADTGDEDRLRGYVFADGVFVNEALVSEGLAYVRLTPREQRFADRLIEAQKKARQGKRGLWKRMKKSSESSYPANTKYGNFHRPSCEEVELIKPDRMRVFKSKKEAFDAGFAPCPKCTP